MEDFSTPLLADSATNYNHHRTSNNNNNNNNSITNNNNMHHHKDHMLAAGSTPSTTSFIYETPPNSTTKTEMSMAKNDYATFTNCIQSALLDHRTAIDANLDAGVSLGALCDLKFGGVTPNAMSANLVSENNTNFKNLPGTMNVIETNMGGGGGASSLAKAGTASTFVNNLFAREATQINNSNNNNNNNTNHTNAHYMSLKEGNEVQSTAEATQQQQHHNQHHHYLTNNSNITITPAGNNRQMSPPGVHTTPDSHNLLDYNIASTSTNNSTAFPLIPSHVLHGFNIDHDLVRHHHNQHQHQRVPTALNENHISTTSVTTTNDTTLNTASNTNNNHSNIIHTTQQQQQSATTHTTSSATTSIAAVASTTTTTNRSSTLHSIEELAASSCTPTSSITTPLNTLVNNTNNIVTAASTTSSSSSSSTPTSCVVSAATVAVVTTATTVPSSVTLNQNDNHKQQQLVVTHLPEPATSTANNNNNTPLHQQHLQQHQMQQQQQQQQQHLLNSSTLSSDSNDSISSSDEFIDMELNDRSGYQDTTSSHSQQSANGGGGGGGGGPPSSNQNSTNPSGPGVSLINGVVTLNSGQATGLTGGGGGGSNNGGSSASSASGTYMSLLPPNVGATSSSSGHLAGVNALGGGTSASASGSTPDVIDFKHLFEELCPVCGDKVSGYHYGLLTCESCKGFFKRTVQNKKVYTCVAERSCHIDKTQRKRCPYCRFQKCLEVGMKLEAVRADRMRGGRNKFGPMYKRDRARKLQVMRQRQIALQALRTSMGTGEIKPTPLSPGYQQAYTNMNIKQEIQIPQVSSLTQSPDSSPSPIAIALGQVNASTGVIATPMNGSSGAGGGGGSGGGGGGGGGNSGNNNNNNSSNTSDGINRVGSGSGGGSGNCHETGTGSLQSASDSKLCFDSGTHPSSTADSIIEPLRVSPMIREFVQSIDDREWQTQLFALLQKQTYNQVEVDLFELMCKVLDQNLFSQVDWARNTVFFKDLKVDDQMKLLQHSWSDMLVLDHLHQRIHNGLPDETQLNNGQVFNLLSLGLLGVPQLSDYFNELQNKLQELKFDMGDYVCMKFLILLNPDVRGIINKKTVLQGHENVQAALLDYTLTCYPSVTDKFRRLLSILPDIHAMAARGEEHLYSKHCAGSAPTQTLLMEMLHAKRKV